MLNLLKYGAAAPMNAARALAEAQNNFATTTAATSLVLAAGGDMRIWPDPVSGRNQYGTLTTPAPDEISFSSTTASNISASAFAAADLALARLIETAPGFSVAPEQWFDDIRADIIAHLGLPGAGSVLAASGTDAELLALGLCAGLSPRPITNIFIAPDETGKGIPQAAGGRHFSNLTALGEAVVPGDLIDGFRPGCIDVQTIAIRDEAGRPRDTDMVDDDAVVLVERALQHGRDVLVHVLDASKTGLRGLTRSVARALACRAPGRVRVVVDACQLRSPLADLRQDLADGFMVTVTGSKFAGGPPFAGALLLPSALMDEIRDGGSLPEGLTDYSAALDWPERVRDRLNVSFKFESNIGLGLRWVAALDSIASYANVGELEKKAIFDCFVREVYARTHNVPGISLHCYDDFKLADAASIVPLTVLYPDGRLAPMAEAQRVQFDLRTSALGPVAHIGQAVRVGPRTVLRASISARDVTAVATRMAAGQSLAQAFNPIASNIDAMFEKWSRVTQRA